MGVPGRGGARYGPTWRVLLPLYAGGFCCGINCNYGVGVARAKDMQGPWEKNPGIRLLLRAIRGGVPATAQRSADLTGRSIFCTMRTRRVVSSPPAGRRCWTALPGRMAGLSLGKATALRHRSSRGAPSRFTMISAPPRLQPYWQWPLHEKPQTRTGGGILTLSSVAFRAFSALFWPTRWIT